MRRCTTVPALAAVLCVAGCAGSGGHLDTSPATRSAPPPAHSAPASAASGAIGATTAAASSRGELRHRYVVVQAGTFAKNPAAMAFAAFYDARLQAVVQHDPRLPAFRRLSAGEYRTYQEGVISSYRRKGWTLHTPQRWVVTGVSRQGRKATVRACQERVGPLVEKTGQPAEEPTGPGAFSIELSKRDGRWVVVHLFAAKSSCVGVL